MASKEDLEEHIEWLEGNMEVAVATIHDCQQARNEDATEAALVSERLTARIAELEGDLEVARQNVLIFHERLEDARGTIEILEQTVRINSNTIDTLFARVEAIPMEGLKMFFVDNAYNKMLSEWLREIGVRND